jgi:hypothetical protein
MAEEAAEKHIFAVSGDKNLYSFPGRISQSLKRCARQNRSFSATCESGSASGWNTLLRSSVKLDEVAL